MCSVPLQRVAAKSNWADAHGFTGKYLDQISVVDLLYRKWDEAALRYLSQGDFVGLVTTRSAAESVLLAAVRDAFRKKRIDIDQLAKGAFHADHPDDRTPDKKAASQEYIGPLISNGSNSKR